MDAPEHVQWFTRGGGADAVKGFLTAASSDALAHLLRHQLDSGMRGNLVEIGTYMGKTFVGLSKASREDELTIGFDLFPDDVREAFRNSLSHLSEAQRARVVAVKADTLRMQTAEWIRLLRAPARFVHIDGGHSYPVIVNDLHLVSSYLTPDALVVLDDFLHDWYPDLTEGIIDGLKTARNIVPVAVIPRQGPIQRGGTKLVCATPDSARGYAALLAERYADKFPRRSRLAGREVLVFQGF